MDMYTYMYTWKRGFTHMSSVPSRYYIDSAATYVFIIAIVGKSLEAGYTD